MKGLIPGGGLVTALLAIGVKLIFNHQKSKKEKQKYDQLIPKIQLGENGKVISVERFGDYVVRQMGLDPDTAAARRLVRVAEDYLRGDKSHSDDSLEHLFVFLTRVCPLITDDEIEDLNKKFVEELDICMVTYFSFHWKHSGEVIDQVINGGSMRKKSFKTAVLTMTRKQRFQRVMKELKTQRWFSNVLEMLKAMEKHSPSTPDQGTVVVPAHTSVRSPVLLMLGGGMGAGKSTVVKEIMKGPFWNSVSSEAVLVEADAFKESDVIYQALSSIGHGENISEAAEFVHESSTNAASALLVTALNEGRDVILDGTMSWEPFVLQTLAMARDVHTNQYRMGPGYGKNADGSSFENYWEIVESWEETVAAKKNATENGDVASGDGDLKDASTVPERKPYRIEFVGVICEAHMAVVRGMRRAIITKRGVPVTGQLRSHKLFSSALEKYCEVMDDVKIYSTSSMGGPAELIATKDGGNRLLKDCDEFKLLEDLIKLNPGATSVLELYGTCESTCSHRNWEKFVLPPTRSAQQHRLAESLNCAQLHHELSELDLSAFPNSPGDSPSSSSLGSTLNSSSSTNGTTSNGSSSPDRDYVRHGPAGSAGRADE